MINAKLKALSIFFKLLLKKEVHSSHETEQCWQKTMEYISLYLFEKLFVIILLYNCLKIIEVIQVIFLYHNISV